MLEHPVKGNDLVALELLGSMVQQSGLVQALGELDASSAVLEVGVLAALEVLLAVEADVHRLVVSVLDQRHLAAALRPIPLDGTAEGLRTDLLAVLKRVGVLLHVAQSHLGRPEEGDEPLGAGALVHHAGDGVALVQLVDGLTCHDAHHAGSRAGADDGGSAIFSEPAAVLRVHVANALQPGVVLGEALDHVLAGGQVLIAGLDLQSGLHHVDAELQGHHVDDQLAALSSLGDLVHVGGVHLLGGALLHQLAHSLCCRQIIVRADHLFDVGFFVQSSADGGALSAASAYHYLFHRLFLLVDLSNRILFGC